MRRANRLRSLQTVALGALLGAGALLNSTNALAQEAGGEEPGPYGLFGAGFHVEGGLGVYQVFGQHGLVPGIYPRGGIEIELSSHFSLYMMGRFKMQPDEGVPDMAQVTVAPGLFLKFREAEWPMAFGFGVGARIGLFSARPELVGLQNSDPAATVSGFPVTPEGTFKLEFWLTSFFPIKAAVSYAPVFIEGQTIHTVEESISAAIVF
jgi:hypothetical protein